MGGMNVREVAVVCVWGNELGILNDKFVTNNVISRKKKRWREIYEPI